MKVRQSGNCVSLADARLSRLFDCLVRLKGSKGQDVEAMTRLRTCVEADLFGRDRPIDLPRLYAVLRGTTMLPILADVVDDVSQQFVVAGKRVVAVLLVLAARIQCDIESADAGFGRLVSNIGPLRALERALCQRLACEFVSFDPRLYAPPLLGLVAPTTLRAHARALICGQSPEAPIAVRPVVPQRQPEWRIVSLLGAAVHSHSNWIDTSAPIPLGAVELAKADLCLEELHPLPDQPEAHVECRAHGVHFLRGGVRFAEDVRRGLRLGVQHYDADPSGWARPVRHL